MVSLHARKLHIFAPYNGVYDGNDWYEQVLGIVVKHIYEKYSHQIEWLFTNRYEDQRNKFKTDGVLYPESPPHVNNGYCRFVALRMSVMKEKEEALFNETIQLARESGCFIHPNQEQLPFDAIAELACERFIHMGANDDEKRRRAELIVRFLDSTTRLFLDSLKPNSSNEWSVEPNAHRANPTGSFFESVHHLFCNATNFLPPVLLFGSSNHLLITTNHLLLNGYACTCPLGSPPILPPENNWKIATAIPEEGNPPLPLLQDWRKILLKF